MNEDVKVVCGVKDKIMNLLHQANKAKEFSMGDVSFLNDAMSALKNSYRVKWMMEEDEDGYSEANRGQRHVRDPYNHGGMDMDHDDYSGRRDGRGRYSREDGTEEMMEHARMAFKTAPEKYKDAARRFMREIETA